MNEPANLEHSTNRIFFNVIQSPAIYFITSGKGRLTPDDFVLFQNLKSLEETNNYGLTFWILHKGSFFILFILHLFYLKPLGTSRNEVKWYHYYQILNLLTYLHFSLSRFSLFRNHKI